MSKTKCWLPAIAASLVFLGCITNEPGIETGGALAEAEDALAETDDEPQELVLPAGEEPPPDDVFSRMKTWTGDFDGMVERRHIRALVTYSMTNYFLDGAEQRGITYEALKEFEKAVNADLGTGHLKVHVLIIPVARDQLIPALLEGRGDIAAANLTITPERKELVGFSVPGYTGVSEIVVTGPSAPEITDIQGLSGKQIHVRASSSYYASLQKLNGELQASGKEAVRVVSVNEHLEDEDLLQMVNAGLIPMIVVDSHKAHFWNQVFDAITLRSDLAVRSGGQIAWAFRKNSPLLRARIDPFIEKNRKGTLLGNILFKRYLQNTKWVEDALSESEIAKFSATIDFFKIYGSQYAFDPLMLAALGYQESRLDQSVRSAAGAVGVMQVLPTTAADPNVGIPDIEELENNIHAGTKYLRFLTDRYFADEGMDPLERRLFTFASYNAGPARVRGLRRKAESAGLDPDVWFDNVEVIAAKEIGRETVQYVSNIFKYYVAYRRIASELERKARAAPSVR